MSEENRNKKNYLLVLKKYRICVCFLIFFIIFLLTKFSFFLLKNFTQKSPPQYPNTFIDYPYISYGNPYKKLNNGSVLFTTGILYPDKNKFVTFKDKLPYGYCFELPNDKVLFLNGIFDLKTNELISFKNNRINRKYYRLNLLNTGNVIFTGGVQDKRLVSDIEILNTDTNRFEIIGKLKIPRANHYAIHTTNDNILLFGGVTTTPKFVRKSAMYGGFQYVLDNNEQNEDKFIEVYNPKLNSSTLKKKPKELKLNEYFIQCKDKILFFNQTKINDEIEISVKLYNCQSNKIKNIGTINSVLWNLKHCFISSNVVYLYFNNNICFIFDFENEQLLLPPGNPFAYNIRPELVSLSNNKILILGGDDAGGWYSKAKNNAVIYDYKLDYYYKPDNEPIYKLKYPKAILIDSKRVLIETSDGYQVYLI